ncbi:MAG: hypothetical protein OXU51_16560 [Candidatus Poribacteria bacterium]|nr:hypothetical protein [Candidatus Poribacteria bacterium]
MCQPSDEIGIFKDHPIAVRTAPAFQAMPLLAGGLDNAFLDTTEQHRCQFRGFRGIL